MKKNLITILILVLPFFISAQQSPKSIFRDHVLLEVFAGTCCANLPGVEMAIGEIIENGDPVVILRHDYCNTTNGLYENAHAVGRYNYYQSFADPVAYFNGTVESYGGGYNSVYPDYSCCIQIELNELTDFDLHFSLENIKGNDFVAHVTAENLNPAVPVENRTLQLALTAMEVRNTWSNQDINIFHCIQVDMFPDHNGTPVDFSTGALQVFDVAFTIDSCYYDNLYRLVGFLQHDLTRDIVQDFYVDLPLPLYQNNAELLNVENISPGLCNEMMAPEVMIQNKGSENIHSLCIHFESSDNANYTYNWSGNIQSYQKEIIIIPENYIGIPADNKIRVFTTLPNGFPDQNPLNDTIVKEINTVDSTEMC